MSQEYSNPKRADDKYALPNVEIFYAKSGELQSEDGEPCIGNGYYYWYCFPGCLPDSDPIGPFDTYAEAFAAMRDDSDDMEDET